MPCCYCISCVTWDLCNGAFYSTQAELYLPWLWRISLLLTMNASSRGITSSRYHWSSFYKISSQSTAKVILKRHYDPHAHLVVMNTRPTGFLNSSSVFKASNAGSQRRMFCSSPEHTGSSILLKKKIIVNDTLQHDSNDAKDEVIIPIDVKTLYDPKIHLSDKPDFNDPSLGYEVSTPLSDELIKLIALA